MRWCDTVGNLLFFLQTEERIFAMPRPLQACKPLLAALGCAAALLALPAHAQSDAQRMATGQWHDPDTGLVWMRCSVGQRWTGSTCSGQPLMLTWNKARAYPATFNQQVALGGHRNWRLPTIAELASLRRCSAGWAQQTRTIGDLTVATGQAETTEIPLGNGTRQVPQYCNNDSREPTWDSQVFPNQSGDEWYWSSSLMS